MMQYEDVIKRVEVAIKNHPEMQAKQTQINEQIEFLGERTEALMKVVCELEYRLSPLLRDLQPNEESDTKALEVVPFAALIRSRAWRVMEIDNKVTSILQRLEL